MRILATAIVLMLTSVGALSQPVAASSATASAPAKTPCEALSADKKLAGAARARFLEKCDADAGREAQAACEAKAVERKLAGAARDTFLKKCVADSSKL